MSPATPLTLTIGTTQFTLEFLRRAWERAQLPERGVGLRVEQVRTNDCRRWLDSKQGNLVCGGLAAPASGDPLTPAHDFIEWHREGLVLVTNLPRHQLNIERIGIERLRTLPLVIPPRGVITDFVVQWYGPDFRSRLEIAAEIGNVHYGLNLLRSGLVRGALLCARSIGQAAIAGQGLPASPDFRLIDFADDIAPSLRLVSGVFARSGEPAADEQSPLHALWEAFKDEAATRQPVSL